MTPELIYMLKVNVGIALFYAFYKLFCGSDTFLSGVGLLCSAFLRFFPLPICSTIQTMDKRTACHI